MIEPLVRHEAAEMRPESLCMACEHFDGAGCTAGQRHVIEPVVVECDEFKARPSLERPWLELEIETDGVQTGRKGGSNAPSLYHRKYKGVWIDLYAVARVYGITDPAHFHAFKKIVRLGTGSGGKGALQDALEALDSLKDLIAYLRER